jgi:glycerol transport system substrate-binding protein
MAKFKEKYGYDLGVPVNWSAYEDIAEFFTENVQEIDGSGLRPHGLRQEGSVARLAVHRCLDVDGRHAGDKGDSQRPAGGRVGHPGGRELQPVGSCVTRGGATNGPAAVYPEKYIEWLKKYAPPQAAGMTFSEACRFPRRAIAQQIFWYTAFTADMVKEGPGRSNEDGTPKWRMAPSPTAPTGKKA